jgi:hypothetical protein
LPALFRNFTAFPTIEPAVIKSLIATGVNDATKDLQKISRAYSNRYNDPREQTPGGPNAPLQQRKRKKLLPRPDRAPKSQTNWSTHPPTTTPTTKAKRSRTSSGSLSLEEKQSIFEEFRIQEEEIARSTSRYFGFCADPAKSSLHNASLILAERPVWFYLQTPRNDACHNLCTRLTPLPNLQALLGLGLSFCPRPTKTSGIRAHVTDRIQREAHLKAFFAHTEERTDYNPKLYISSEWEAPEALILDMLKSCLENFFIHMKSTFRKRHVNPNLLLFQRQILNDLRESKDLLIVMTDQKLGPALIERDVYTRRVFTDHLLKNDTYGRIEKDEAAQILTRLKMKFGQLLNPSLRSYRLTRRNTCSARSSSTKTFRNST